MSHFVRNLVRQAKKRKLGVLHVFYRLIIQQLIQTHAFFPQFHRHKEGVLRECNRKGSQSHKRKPISHFHLFLLAEKYGNENSWYRELSQLVFQGIVVFLDFQKLLTSNDLKFHFKINKSQQLIKQIVCISEKVSTHVRVFFLKIFKLGWNRRNKFFRRVYFQTNKMHEKG